MIHRKWIYLSISLCCFTALSAPKISHILRMDEKFSKNVIIVEKSTHSLHIYKNLNGEGQLSKSYKIATGKRTGNKLISGDKKTPEGIYQLGEFYSQDYLLSQYGDAGKIYGAGAFTLNYPNPFDRALNKTGYGIWLHSTDDDKRVNKGLDSRGCIVATDADIKDIANYIELKKTTIIVTEDIEFSSQEAWTKNREQLQGFFQSWSQSWKNKDFKNYISHYSKEQFFDKRKGNYKSYARYKKYIFSKRDKPQIDFKNISIFRFKDTAVIAADQYYNSLHINDVGRKTLSLKLDSNYKWKIINESWSALKDNERTIFFANNEN